MIPPAWIHDCQASIINAVEVLTPQTPDFLCVFHVIRAWDRQLHVKCRDHEATAIVIDLLHQIAMEIEDPSEVDEAIEAIRETLAGEAAALHYLETTWFTRLQKWAFCERGDFDRTNNLEQSHFHSLKTAHLLNKTQWRIDTLVVKLVTQVMKDFYVHEARDLDSHVDVTSFEIDLESIPFPNEEQVTEVQIVNRLCHAFVKKAASGTCDVRMLIKQLESIL
jgi:hypothetical protein